MRVPKSWVDRNVGFFLSRRSYHHGRLRRTVWKIRGLEDLNDVCLERMDDSALTEPRGTIRRVSRNYLYSMLHGQQPFDLVGAPEVEAHLEESIASCRSRDRDVKEAGA